MGTAQKAVTTHTYRVTVQVDKLSRTTVETNTYGDVVTAASNETTELVCASFSTATEDDVRLRVARILDAAGISQARAETLLPSDLL